MTVCQEFKHAAPIHLKEFTGVIHTIQRKFRQSRFHRHFHPGLCDNMSVCLAIEKGRCSNPRVLRQCQRFAALLLASGSRFRCRWIVSEENPSDHASRLFERLPGDAGDRARLAAAGARAFRGPVPAQCHDAPPEEAAGRPVWRDFAAATEAVVPAKAERCAASDVATRERKKW